MLTITDYVKMLLDFRDDPEGMQEFWNLPIRTWYQKRTSKPTLPSGDIVHCSVCLLFLGQIPRGVCFIMAYEET